MDMSEYKEVFKAESEEHIQQLNDALLGLEQDIENMEHISVMFRSAHTLKGMAATMGFTTIAELTHQMENLMDKIRNNEAKLDVDSIDVLFECLDTLEALVGAIDSGEEVDISHLQVSLSVIISRESFGEQTKSDETQEEPESEQPIEEEAEAELEESAVESTSQIDVTLFEDDKADIEKAQKSGRSVFVADVSLEESCLLKAARSTLVLRNISELGDIIKTIPSLADLEDEKFDFNFKVLISTDADVDTVKEKIENVSEINNAAISVLSKKAESAKTAEIAGKTVKRETTKTKSGTAVTRTDAIKSVQSVRVNIERLDNLMNLVGELIITKIRLNQLASELDTRNLDETLANFDRLTNEIQTEVMESRMVPIDQIFSRFPRMVRDLAKSEGKEINLVIEGKEIELDRTVLDEIGDPLVHLLRNSVDHGVEETEKRTELGKSRAGLLRLAASRQRNNVIIEVEDDGKGMNPQHLREIAVKKGMMNQADAEKLSDGDALNLIFAAGFSGAKVVTDVSGRGVGMDVVKTKIETLGGSVNVESTEGSGTKVQLQLPLTVAIIQSLMVKVVDEVYAIPLTSVIRDVGIKASEIKTVEGQEVILLRGEVLPLLRLHRVLKSTADEEDKENLIVVVVEKMGNNVGLVVDELIGQQEVIIKTLDSKMLKNTKGFAGATILGDGSVALILDIATLI